MGKYTHLRHKLPAFKEAAELTGLAGWFAKVDEWKGEFLGTNSGENANATMLGREYAERNAKKKQLEDEEVPQLNIELEALSQLGIQAMEGDGTEKIVLANGGYVRIDDLPFPYIKDKAAAIAWFLKNGMPEMLEASMSGMTKKQLASLELWCKKNGLVVEIGINSNTLQALTRRLLLEGKTPPDGVKIFMKTKLAVKGVKGTNGNDLEE
jgi:hypothetical protein